MAECAAARGSAAPASSRRPATQQARRGLKSASLALLLSMLVMGSSAAGTLNGDEDLGKIVEDRSPDDVADNDGEVDPNFNPATVLPFTEEQERKRSEMQLKFKDELNLDIDSIEPEAGPITGETRVLVHGGPFENMELLYPRPKCKFG